MIEMAQTTDRDCCAHGSPSPFEIEADHCSACGEHPPNEDYVLYEEGTGMCVADGIGGAPLGDAAARYACHIAMDAMRRGLSTREAVETAREGVASFANTIDSPGSGTSLVVARINGDELEASWAGNAAIFVASHAEDEPSLLTSLECKQPRSDTPLCGGSRACPGRLSLTLQGDEVLAICTDGTWRAAGKEGIGRVLLGDASPREMAARLVLVNQSRDDSTALIARIRRCQHAKTTVASEGSTT
jgi:serine/threonine protein phosphatase PrpC